MATFESDEILLETDLGTPQKESKEAYILVLSSESEPGTPEKQPPIIMSSESEPGTPEKQPPIIISSESDTGTPEKPKEKRTRIYRTLSTSDDDSDPELDELKEFLGPQTPVYDTSRQGFSATEILNIVLGKIPSSKLCTRKPCGVRTFASFVIDLNHVSLRDLHADDNGSWSTSSPRRLYEVEKEGGVVLSAKAISPRTNLDNSVVTIYRQYGIHKGTPEFRRIIATVCDSTGKRMPRAIVQYFFTGGKKVQVKIPAHGNSSRNARPYYRTQPSTLHTIKQECQQKSPALTYHHMLEVAGGIEESKSISEEPRNRAQVYNARKHCIDPNSHSKDEIFDLLEKLQTHEANTDGGFLREVVVGSTPCVILASKQQLDNLVSFCCQPHHFAVLGVDATFQLGDFYVTLTTFHNPMLQNPRTGKQPVFAGPVFIHMQRRYEDYYTFFAGLLKLQPQLASLKAYGTNGEEALVSALRACFPNAVGLRCFVHKQRNLEEHLHTVSATARNEIVRDIFGVQDGEVFSKGLVDAESTDAFNVSLQRLQERWNTLAPGFHKWFMGVQAETFRNYMISPVRERAQLGSPPQRYTTNPNESINSTVKKWVGYTKSSWPAFVDKMQNLEMAPHDI